MKYFLVIIFITLKSFSQKSFILYDSINNDFIPFSYIKIKNKIYTSNEKGKVTFQASKNDTLFFKHSFYEDKTILSKKIKDTVFLKPIREILENIDVVSYKGYKTKSYSQKNNFGFIIPAKASEITSCLKFKDKKIKEAYLKSISFEISTKNRLTKYINKINVDDNYLVKLNLYSCTNDLYPTKNIDKSIIKKVFIKPILNKSFSDNKNKFLISFDVKHFQIKILNQSICVGLEIVDSNISDEKLKEKVMFHPFLTLKNNRNIEAKTYFAGVFEKAEFNP